MIPQWQSYDEGGGYLGRRWSADGVCVTVMCTAEWHVTWGEGFGLHGTAISVAAAERYALRARLYALLLLQDLVEMRAEQRWPTTFLTLMREIIGKFPVAAHHLAGEPILPFIIPRTFVSPQHLEIPSRELRDLAYREIERHNDFHGTDVQRYSGKDAVLVLGPAR